MTLQDLGGRGLLLERFLRLVEQAHVLDRDHRLVGEGLEQLDLLSGESAPRFHGRRTIAPMRLAVAQHRHAEHRAPVPPRSAMRRGVRRDPPARRRCASSVRLRRMLGPRAATVAPHRAGSLACAAMFPSGKPCDAAKCKPLAVVAEDARDTSASQRRWRHCARSRRTPAAMSVGEPADHAAGSPPSRSAARAPPCVSLNRRTFSIAITAWSAKVLSSAICFSLEGPHLGPAHAGSCRSPRPRASAARPAMVRWPNLRASSRARVRKLRSPALCRSCDVDDRRRGSRVPMHRARGRAASGTVASVRRRADGAAAK